MSICRATIILGCLRAGEIRMLIDLVVKQVSYYLSEAVSDSLLRISLCTSNFIDSPKEINLTVALYSLGFFYLQVII